MKKSIIYFNIFLIFIMLTSCANQSRFINPEYSDITIKDPILLLPQFENYDFIENENLFNELDINYSKEEYYDYFLDNFEKNLDEQSIFDKIQYIKYDTAPRYETRTLNLNKKEKFTFDLPSQPLNLNISGSVFILFLEDLRMSFSRKTKEATTSTRTYKASGTTEKDVQLHSIKEFKYYITLDSKYVLYDNSNGELVSYGTASSVERFIPPSPIEHSISRLINHFTGKIFKKTPFEI